MADARAAPDEVRINDAPREPVSDPTLGIDVPRPDGRAASHRLVTVGDSLTHGFMSAAIHRTDLSWPAIVAYELGLTAEQFTYPTYEWPTGPGGLPLDLERLARAFEKRYGDRLDFWELVGAAAWLRSYMDQVEDYWERGEGSGPPATGAPFHNMAVYGWDLLDPQLQTATTVAARIRRPTGDDFLAQLVEHHQDRAAWPVLQRARKGNRPRSVLDAVTDLSRSGGGVETLVVVLGSNNALGSVLSLSPAWTPADYPRLSPEERLEARIGCNVWRPSAFAADWELLVQRLRGVAAQHVVLATVPSVTIAPITRGVYRKVSPDSRYFPFYTRPWISDDDFDPRHDPHLTAAEAQGIDSAIDAYNESIIASVAAARADGLDWYLFDMGSLLDRLATRRYIESPWARPAWWTAYPLPPALQALDPVPSTRFFRSGPEGRTEGGLFSLDGVHPTTVGYGILAQEVIRVMELAGVEFSRRDGSPRAGPVTVDFERLLRADTLLSRPPASVGSTLSLLGWLDDRLDWVRTFLPFVPSPL
ncbi:hypothetical protein ACT8ZV_19720 [Nocardioides sp. MAHUQ-72]|uniref:hypothetical protein n=1 Tax=unclassified Nocardioides TaxID=2615069 RepID=UPI00361810A9